MTNENGMLDSLNQEVSSEDTSVVATDKEISPDEKYLNQKIRAEKAEKALSELMKQKKEQEVVAPKSADASLSRLDEVEQKVELRMSGYSKEEIAFAEKLAKGSGQKLTEIINDSFFKDAIEGSRAKNKATSDTPAPSSRTATFKGKSANEIFVDANASKEDKQAAFNAVLNAKKGINKFN